MCPVSLATVELFVVCYFTGSLALSSQLPATNSCSLPWFVWGNNSCQCGSSLGDIVTCQDDPVSVKVEACYCMTVDGSTEETVVGSCPYTCAKLETWYSNKTELDYRVCREVWKRTGVLCSQCVGGHGPLVYSYGMQCAQCPHSVVRDSVVAFLASFLPLTVFCLAIMTLRISVARPPMSTFVLASQVMTSPQYFSLLFVPEEHRSYASSYVPDGHREMCWKLFSAFFGLWNLDIFRSFYPQMCLGPHISTLQAKYLEYLVALFPLVILLGVYISIHLYYHHGYRVFCVCKPVIFGLARLRHTIDIQASLIDAFSTFIILSVIKVGYTSFIILQPVHIYSPDGSLTTKVYTDPSFAYFGLDHLPYALTALLLMIVLIFVPLLFLFLYPLKSFQKFLNRRQWQCSTLHIFADTFQGCYKDGTNGTRDFRWFAGLHLLLRFILVLFFDASHYQKPTILLMPLTLSLYMSLLTMCQPYKENLYLKLDMIVLFGLLLWSTALVVYVLGYDGPNLFAFGFHLSLLILATLIPFLYITGFALYWVIFLKRLHLAMFIKVKAVLNRDDEGLNLW